MYKCVGEGGYEYVHVHVGSTASVQAVVGECG